MYIRFVIDVRTLDEPFRDQESHHKIDHSCFESAQPCPLEIHVSNVSDDVALGYKFACYRSTLRTAEGKFVFIALKTNYAISSED